MTIGLKRHCFTAAAATSLTPNGNLLARALGRTGGGRYKHARPRINRTSRVEQRRRREIDAALDDAIAVADSDRDELRLLVRADQREVEPAELPDVVRLEHLARFSPADQRAVRLIDDDQIVILRQPPRAAA